MIKHLALQLRAMEELLAGEAPCSGAVNDGSS